MGKSFTRTSVAGRGNVARGSLHLDPARSSSLLLVQDGLTSNGQCKFGLVHEYGVARS